MSMQWLAQLIRDPNVFSYLILFLYGCSSARYLIGGDFGRATYWVAAALITFSVTFMIKH